MTDETTEPTSEAHEKPEGACRFGECTALATTRREVVIGDDTWIVPLCDPHANMVRGQQFPEALRGFEMAPNGIVVGLPTPEEPAPQGEQPQAPDPDMLIFVPMRQQTGPHPLIVREQMAPTGEPVVTMESPLHPGELWVFPCPIVPKLVKALQGAHRRALMLPPPAQHPMAQAPIVSPNGG